MKLDRFDFEQQIYNCWKITDDLKDVSESMTEKLTSEQVSAILLGLKELYEIKFNKLWDCFEDVHMELVRENTSLRIENKTFTGMIDRLEMINYNESTKHER